jgi:hypothetical protein
MARVIIEGFKTQREAKEWALAYEGGVEQDMDIWAEERDFPCMTDEIIERDEDVIVTLRPQ